MSIYVKCNFCGNVFKKLKSDLRKQNYCNHLCTAWAKGQKIVEWRFFK
jgi:uncharacterized C2H2 Zn-finger protein